MSIRDLLNQIIPPIEHFHPGYNEYEDDTLDHVLMPVFCPFCFANLTEIDYVSFCPSCGRNISGNARKEDYGKRSRKNVANYPAYDPEDDDDFDMDFDDDEVDIGDYI